MRREFSAGGVVVDRERVAVIVPRGQSDILALPKGLCDPGESAAATALREVREETGVEAELVDSLAEIQYWFDAPRRAHLEDDLSS